MAATPLHALVLSDHDGTYSLLSRDLLDQARVPAEQAGELRRLMEGDDTRGAAAVGPFPTITPPTAFVAAPKTSKGDPEPYYTMTMEGAFITK
jgi:hypothetical protein